MKQSSRACIIVAHRDGKIDLNGLSEHNFLLGIVDQFDITTIGMDDIAQYQRERKRYKQIKKTGWGSSRLINGIKTERVLALHSGWTNGDERSLVYIEERDRSKTARRFVTIKKTRRKLRDEVVTQSILQIKKGDVVKTIGGVFFISKRKKGCLLDCEGGRHSGTHWTTDLQPVGEKGSSVISLPLCYFGGYRTAVFSSICRV